MKVTVFDYGAGNIHSIVKAVALPGITVSLESDARAALDTDALILPGVGAFAQATACIGDQRERMAAAIAGGLPTLGICLGMQLLFDSSEEGGGRGLGVIPGRVRRLRAATVPQIGWNSVETMDEALPAIAYFANSYVCEPDDEETIVAYTTHQGDRFASAVATGSVAGVQFHPEKSSAAGVAFIHAFVEGART